MTKYEVSLFNLFGRENRSSSTITQASTAGWDIFDMGRQSEAGETVTEASALGVPAIWQAVNLIAGTIANLPFHLYKMQDGAPVKATRDPLYNVVGHRANDVHTKFVFFKFLVTRLALKGRAFALILRDQSARVRGFLPLDEGSVTVTQRITNGLVTREYRVGSNVYPHTDIIDLALSLKADGVSHYSPIDSNRDAIGLMIAVERYASRLFAGGGIPAMALHMMTSSPQAQDKASEEFSNALKIGRDRKRNVVPVPVGFELKTLGLDPQSQQMIEVRRFQIGEASRIFNVAPALLFDLSTGTYSNVEQQHLSFATQTIAPIVKLIEQEFNLKLFGQRNTSNYVEFNLDALVRGDLKSRTEALARAVNSALITPNEARALDNRAPLDGGDELFIQGATVPLTKAGEVQPQPEPPKLPNEPDSGDEPADE